MLPYSLNCSSIFLLICLKACASLESCYVGSPRFLYRSKRRHKCMIAPTGKMQTEKLRISGSGTVISHALI